MIERSYNFTFSRSNIKLNSTLIKQLATSYVIYNPKKKNCGTLTKEVVGMPFKIIDFRSDTYKTACRCLICAKNNLEFFTIWIN